MSSKSYSSIALGGFGVVFVPKFKSTLFEKSTVFGRSGSPSVSNLLLLLGGNHVGRRHLRIGRRYLMGIFNHVGIFNHLRRWCVPCNRFRAVCVVLFAARSCSMDARRGTHGI
jgi:hypothetical protein